MRHQARRSESLSATSINAAQEVNNRKQREDAQMNEHYDPMPVALYARVSSDRHDVDCWQPAKVAHFETREIRDFMEVL